MIALNHALTGAAIGLAVQKPYLIVPVAFLSHFVLDMVPHFGHKKYKWGDKIGTIIFATDGAVTTIALICLAVFAPHLILPAMLGAFFAMLPDVFWIHYYSQGKPKHWFYTFHSRIQWFERPPGALVEASYLVLIGTTITALIR